MRFGYDGSGLGGWARQPHSRTVEGLIRAGLRPRGISPTPDAARLEVASRTDRGVSARANALALWSDLTAAPLLRRMNTISPELVFTAAASISQGFRVRSAVRRVYRYFEPVEPTHPEEYARSVKLFQGRIDVRSFGREIPARTPRWRSVESVTVTLADGGRTIEVRAPSFVWGMVRKIVGSLREVGAGRLSVSRLEAAVAGETRLTLPMAEPEGLVLWDVEYPLEWEARWAGPNRYQQRCTRRRRDGLWQQEQLLGALFAAFGSPGTGSTAEPPPGREELG